MEIKFTVNVDPAFATALATAFGPLFKSLQPKPGVTPADLNALKGEIMNNLQDKIDSLNKAVDTAVTRVQKDIDTLTGKVADLQAKVDAGDATPEEIQALDAIQAKIDAIDPSKPDVLPPTP